MNSLLETLRGEGEREREKILIAICICPCNWSTRGARRGIDRCREPNERG